MPDQEVGATGADSAPGEVLASAREELGITQREVSDALNLPVSTVVAIEEGDLERLPALVFTRGYVRAYAKLLELDAQPLVAALGDDNGEQNHVLEALQRDAAAPSADSLLPPGLDIHHLLKPRNLAVGAGVLLTLVVLVVVLMGGDDGADTSVDAPVLAADPAPTPAPAPQTQATQQAPQQSTQQVLIVDAPEAVTATETQTQTRTQIETLAETPQPVAVADPASLPQREDAARRLTELGDDRLSLLFTEDCWVEIKDTSDNTLFGDLGRAGQQLELVGSGPFRVLLGYAPGVLLKYNDEPVALSPHTRNNVASLVLGQ